MAGIRQDLNPARAHPFKVVSRGEERPGLGFAIDWRIQLEGVSLPGAGALFIYTRSNHDPVTEETVRTRDDNVTMCLTIRALYMGGLFSFYPCREDSV